MNMKTILIVDDSEMAAIGISAAFPSEYRIQVVTDGLRAISVCQGNNPPDIILLDVSMPEINGFEVCRRLKADIRSASIPVIFITGMNSPDDEEKGLQVGAVDYIHKPFTPSIVLARVTTHLALRDSMDAVKLQQDRLIELERQQAEEQIGEIRKRLEYVMAATGEGIWDYNIGSRTVCHNATWCNLLGLDNSYLEHNLDVFAKIIHEDDRETVFQSITSAIKGCRKYTSVHRMRRFDGTVIWVLDRGRVVEWDQNGSPTRMVGSISDITAERQAEEEIKKGKQMLRTILDTTSEAIYGTDLDGLCTFCNAACLRLLGYDSEQELIGKNMHNLIHHTKSDGLPFPVCECRIFQAFTKCEPTHVDDELLWRKDGDSFLAEYWSNPQIVDGILVGAVVTFIDITQRKKNEANLVSALVAAEAANIAKSQFLSNMSHEIRTPMNGVIGLSQLLINTKLDDKQRDYLAKITASGRHLVSIINDILDFSKIEAGKLKLEQDDFRLDSVIDNVANLTALECSKKHLSIVFVVSPHIPFILNGDAIRLGQVLINLVSNAIKFTSDGEVIVYIAAVEHFSDTIRLRCSIKDTGIGLTDSQQSMLFRPFSQADASTTRQYGGTGLGLAVSRHLCELMSGGIDVISQFGLGSTFTFSAVLGLSNDRRSVVEVVGPTFSGLRALVIQENRTSRDSLVETLLAFSIFAKSLDSPLDSFEELISAKQADAPYDIIIFDERMVELDGLEAAQIVLGDQTFSPSPRIFLTVGFGNTNLSAQAKSIGVAATLEKPLGTVRLIEAIASAFDRPILFPLDCKPLGVIGPHEGLRDAMVLLAEDNEINREIALGLLSTFGVNVEIAFNGKMAVDMVKSNPGRYHAILMDIQMPVMDGIEACKIIRQFENTQTLPIIAMTAHALDQERDHCFRVGMNDHISKPIDAQTLFNKLIRWLCPEMTNVSQQQVQNVGTSFSDDSCLPGYLPPFEILEALNRVNGDKKLLRSLLLMFRDRYKAAPEDILRLHKNGPKSELIRFVHTIRGVCASLGAYEAFKIARNVENALNLDIESDISADVQELSDALGFALKAANTI